MRILAIKLRQLGDTVLWTSALQALRDFFPEDQIDLAYPKQFEALFHNDPRISQRIPVEGGLPSLELLRDLRKRHYDLSLTFHASGRSLLLTLGVGAKEKLVHHHSRQPRNYFSDRPIVNAGSPQAAEERDLNVLRTLGWKGESPQTRLFISSHSVDPIRKQLIEKGWNEKEKLCFIGIEATRLAKQWPLEKFAVLCRLLGSHVRPVVIYQTDEALKRDPYFARELKNAALCLRTPQLSDLMAALSLASLFISCDSGAKHVACALGVPTVTLFGPESIGEWHKYDPTKHPVLQHSVLCRTNDPVPQNFSWCGVNACPYSSHACMSLTLPEDVLNTALKVLQ